VNNAARTPHFLDGLDDTNFGAEPTRITTEEIKQRTHIANGGEVAQQPDCPKCNGRGTVTIGYTHARQATCFKCQGTGKVTVRVYAAAKGKATKEANQLAWRDEHKAEIAYAHKRAEKGNNFYRGMIEKLNAYGTLTEAQLRAIQTDIDKDDAFWKAKKAEQDAAAPKVEITAIEALFETAVENDIKRPIFRADGLEISKAPANGRNAGALYVKAAGEYAGKIVGGKFHKVYAAPADVTDRLMAVAADPLAEAMKYGRKTGNCALCGRTLVDPVSIRALIGPVCAPKWNLDWKRELAREELAAERDAQ
jgi:hypothetical protein